MNGPGKVEGSADLLRSLKARHGSIDAIAQSSTSLGLLISKALCNLLDLINSSCNTAPCVVLQCGVTLSVQAKMGVVLAFNEPVPALIAVSSPWLDG